MCLRLCFSLLKFHSFSKLKSCSNPALGQSCQLDSLLSDLQRLPAALLKIFSPFLLIWPALVSPFSTISLLFPSLESFLSLLLPVVSLAAYCDILYLSGLLPSICSAGFNLVLFCMSATISHFPLSRWKFLLNICSLTCWYKPSLRSEPKMAVEKTRSNVNEFLWFSSP